MTPTDFIHAARVPESLKPQAFGPWRIERRVNRSKLWAPKLDWLCKVGFESYTLLTRYTWATLHTDTGDVVMEDSRRELQKHLPIWLNAEGRVLVTGLGLGCVVRGLLASKRVKHITVVEIDRNILRVVGHEFKSNGRVTLVHGDALTVQIPGTFDFAWHDLWTEGETHLQVLHAELLFRFKKQCGAQGAWELPRWMKAQIRDAVPLLANY